MLSQFEIDFMRLVSRYNEKTPKKPMRVGEFVQSLIQRGYLAYNGDCCGDDDTGIKLTEAGAVVLGDLNQSSHRSSYSELHP